MRWIRRLKQLHPFSIYRWIYRCINGEVTYCYGDGELNAKFIVTFTAFNSPDFLAPNLYLFLLCQYDSHHAKARISGGYEI